MWLGTQSLDVYKTPTLLYASFTTSRYTKLAPSISNLSESLPMSSPSTYFVNEQKSLLTFVPGNYSGWQSIDSKYVSIIQHLSLLEAIALWCT